MMRDKLNQTCEQIIKVEELKISDKLADEDGYLWDIKKIKKISPKFTELTIKSDFSFSCRESFAVKRKNTSLVRILKRG